MRLLIYGINYAPELTGVGKYTAEMAETLAALGHEVRVVTAYPYYPAWKVEAGFSPWRYENESIRGVKVWRCPLWVLNRPSGLKRVLHLASFAISSLPLSLWQGASWRPGCCDRDRTNFFLYVGRVAGIWFRRCESMASHSGF